MAKPTLLTVDDDPNVLKAIERDLRARYGEKYRVLRANSGDAGLELLRELRVGNDAVALLLADQRMPQMDGIGFLNEARKVYPDAKRAPADRVCRHSPDRVPLRELQSGTGSLPLPLQSH
jgi:thioredoxin reductase (NADPH)